MVDIATAIEHKFGCCSHGYLFGHYLLLCHIDGDECTTIFGRSVRIRCFDGIEICRFHIFYHSALFIHRAVELCARNSPVERCFACVHHKVAIDTLLITCIFKFAGSIANHQLIFAECFGYITKVDHYSRVGKLACHAHRFFTSGAHGERLFALEIAVGERCRHTIAGSCRYAIVSALQYQCIGQRIGAAIFSDQALRIVDIYNAILSQSGFISRTSGGLGFGIYLHIEVYRALAIAHQHFVGARYQCPCHQADCKYCFCYIFHLPKQLRLISLELNYTCAYLVGIVGYLQLKVVICCAIDA